MNFSVSSIPLSSEPRWALRVHFASRCSRPVSSFIFSKIATQREMRKGSIGKVCLLVGIGLHVILTLTPSFDARSLFDTTTQRAETGISSGFYSYWEDSEMEKGGSRNISIVVELTGEFGNHLYHIAHGRAIQTTLWKDHQIPSHLIFRRHSSREKYRSTQQQLKTCFGHLRRMEIHGPHASSIPPQRTLENLQRSIFGDQRAQELTIQTRSGHSKIKTAVETLLRILETEPEWRNDTVRDTVAKTFHHVSLPFLRTTAMITRNTMDLFYDDFRGFFDFDEDVCCVVEDLPNPESAVFHFRNFLGELKKGKVMGMEELSPTKVATEVFGPGSPSNATSVAIATRFPGRKATEDYADALRKRGINTLMLAMNAHNSTLAPSQSAMQDFCAMRRTKELVGTVRSTFVVWAALLGNTDGVARLYSVDSISTRKKMKKDGKPIFRTYNWTHLELRRRIHFELYQADDVD